MSKYTVLLLVNGNYLSDLHLPLTFSSRLRSAADLQRTVAFAPRKKVTARMRLRKKALKKYRATTLRKEAQTAQ